MPKPLMNTEMISTESARLVDNFTILEPDLPAELLAVKIVDDADPEFLGELSRSLLVAYFRAAIQSRRTAISRERYKRFLLPRFEHLPRIIVGKRDKRVRLIDATFADLRHYCKVLSAKYGERRKSDPKLKQAKDLRDLLRKKAATTRGITASESLGLDFNDS